MAGEPGPEDDDESDEDEEIAEGAYRPVAVDGQDSQVRCGEDGEREQGGYRDIPAADAPPAAEPELVCKK